MKAMRTLFIFLTGCLCGLAARANTLDNIRKKYDLPAVGYIEIIDGKIGEPHVSGVRKYGTPETITKESKFHLGSCGKSMTAMLVHTFIAEEKLSLHTKLKDLDRMFGGKIFGYPLHKRFQNVTIGDLLTHRSGLPDGQPWSDIIAVTKKYPDVKKQREELTKTTLTTAPKGKRGTFAYSNVAFVILASILEKISEKSWEDLMRERVFGPLEMKDAQFGAPKGPNQPWPHLMMTQHRTPVSPEATPEKNTDLLEIVFSPKFYVSKNISKDKIPFENGFILTNDNRLYPIHHGKPIDFDVSMKITDENVQGVKINDRFGVPKAKKTGFHPVKDTKKWKKIVRSIADTGKWFYSDLPPVYGPAGLISCSLEDWAKFALEHINGLAGKSKVFGRYPEPVIKKLFKTLHTPSTGTIPRKALPRKVLNGCGGYSFGGFFVCKDRKGRFPGKILIHPGSNTLNYSNIHIIPEKKSSSLFVMNACGASDEEEKVGEEVLNKIFVKNN